MTRAFSINYTTDLHGYIFPTDYLDSALKEQGLSRLVGGFEQGGNALTIDGGDLLQGSPFTAMLHKLRPDSRAMADAMNRAGYDYVTLGNHDFNYGLAHLKTYLDHLSARCLCCNVRDKRGELPITPYHIRTLANGLRVGLIGAVTHFILKWEKKETVDALLIENPYEAVRRILPTVRGKSDVVVLIYHGGFEKDVDTGKAVSDTDENQGWMMAGLPGIDLLLTGHQHQRIAGKTVRGTPVVQAGCNAQCFARVQGSVDGQGRVHIVSRLDKPVFAPDTAMLAALQREEDAVQRALDESLSELDAEIADVPPLERALHGSLAANFINQVQREVSGAPISACAIAAERLTIPRCLSVREVLAAYPYANTLFVLSMTGALLKRYIETTLTYFDVIGKGGALPADSPLYPLENGGAIAVSEPFLKPKIAHYNYDFFSGIHYTFDLAKPPMRRLVSCKMDGQEIDENAAYTVCLNSYRAGGSGGYGFLREATVLGEIQRDVATLMIEYLNGRPRAHVDQTRYLTAILPQASGKAVLRRHAMQKEIIGFLLKAKRATYAGKGAETAPSRMKSHDLVYQEGDLLYYDTYLGGERFAGEEALWVSGTPYWSMNYMGRVTGENFNGDFLKEALLHVPFDAPYRGPMAYANGDYSYQCAVSGNFEWFQGKETIGCRGAEIYECYFHGGLVR